MRLVSGYFQCKELLESIYAFDGLIVPTEVIAAGAIRCLKNQGLSVPWNVRVLSLTGSFIGKIMETPLSSMEFDARSIGTKAIRILIDSLENNKEIKAKNIEIDFKLIERESTN